TVEALSFEYCSVAINRPWFRSAVFDARFWRLPEGFAPLSDGGDPPQGAWPAYAAALVFVRNVTLTMKTTGPGPTPAGPTPALPIELARPIPTTPPPTPTPSTVTLQGTRDDITILALICKRIPKSPDPDPALTW